MKLDFKKINEIKKSSNSKNMLTKDNEELLREVLVLKEKEFDKVMSNSNYETALLLSSRDNFLANKGKVNTSKLKPKDIVMVDLGSESYGHEFAYEHPCIVIYNEYNSIFVVPCTSQPARKDKRTGKPYPDILEGAIQDGFKKPTTILLKGAKFIDKSRVKSHLGTVSHDFYNEIYNKLFDLIFEPKAYQISKLEEKIEENLKKQESLEDELHKIKQENERLEKINSKYQTIKSLILKNNDNNNLLEELKNCVD